MSLTTLMRDPHILITSDLIASYLLKSNKYWKQIVASGYPSISGGVIQWQSAFGSGVANFAWNEWAIDNGGTGTAGGTANDNSTVSSTLFFNRAVASLGTKASGTTATITVTITET